MNNGCGLVEDLLRCHHHSGSSETSFSTGGHTEIEGYDVTRSQHQATLIPRVSGRPPTASRSLAGAFASRQWRRSHQPLCPSPPRAVSTPCVLSCRYVRLCCACNQAYNIACDMSRRAPCGLLWCRTQIVISSAAGDAAARPASVVMMSESSWYASSTYSASTSRRL